MKKRLLHILLFVCSTAFCSNSFALSSDRDQPADISSDEVDIDLETGRRTFIGNVRFVQGTLKVKGDRVDATFKDGKLVKAIAYGKPAAFRQRPDGKKDDVEGRGLTIVMNQQNNTLTLKKRASLKQGFDTINGQTIIYNMETDKLKVKGNSAISQNNKKKKSTSKPKTKTDPFFNEKKPAAAPKPNNNDSSKAPVEEVQTAPSTGLPAQSDDKPEKLILPGQASEKKPVRESSGRSRLIIKPKSK